MKRGNDSAYRVRISACPTSSPSTSARTVCSSSRAVTYEYAGSFSISAREARMADFQTSSSGTPS